MPTEAPEEFFEDGIPVEIGKVNRELKKLWQDSDQVATRASRLNLVIYSTAEHSLRANTASVEQVARQHALRAILISAKPQAGGNRVRAWINAHCQVSKSGEKQRCSEQIAFQLEGDARDLGFISNIVFSHLDGDLPLYLWWQGAFPCVPDQRLMDWVDCLIFDSADWTDVPSQIAIVERLAADSRLENSLGDINWGRITGWRVALAQFFDAPGALSALGDLSEVEIDHAPGARLTATLLVGWLAAQLGWTPQPGSADAMVFDADGKRVAISLFEKAGPPLTRVHLKTRSGAECLVTRDANSRYLNASSRLDASGREARQMLPVGAEDTPDLVSDELSYAGEHRCYRKALRVLAELGRLDVP